MKHLIVFSPIFVVISSIPVYIISGKAKYYGYDWLSVAGKYYLFVGIPLYTATSLLWLLFMLITGKYVKRIESASSLSITLFLTAIIYFLASALSGLASQGAGH